MVPGGTDTGCRRPTTVRGWDARVGTRAATARSVRLSHGPSVRAPARERRRLWPSVADVRTARRSGARPSPGSGLAHPRRAASFATLGRVDRARLIGIALVVVSAIAFGSGGLFARPVYATGVDWLTLMAWRFLIAGALGWALLLARSDARRALRAMPRRQLLVTIGLGVVYVGNTATYYAGITTVDLSLAALIVYIYPPVVAVLALQFGRPLEGRRAWTALGIAVAGVVLAVGGIPESADPADRRPAADHRLAAALLGLDHPGGPALRGAAGPDRATAPTRARTRRWWAP